MIIGTEEGTSKTVTSFSNPGAPEEKIVRLEGNPSLSGGDGTPPFKNATPYFELPIGKNVILPDSRLHVSPADTGTGNYALNPSIDVGVDGDLEWAFQGEGYGEFGHQDQFSNDATKRTVKYLFGGGHNTNLKIKIPREADVTDAYMDIGGRLSSPTFNGYSINTASRPQGLHVTDVDDDGDNDFIVACYSSNSIRWYENPTDPFDTGGWTSHTIGSLSQVNDVTVGYFDGDEYLDVAAVGYSVVRWYRHPGGAVSTAGNWDDTTVGTGLRGGYGIDADDVDGDGDDDIVATQYNWMYDIYYFDNANGSGDGQEWTRNRIATSVFYYPSGISLGDLNNDGILDVALGTRATWSASQGLICIIAPATKPDTGTWKKSSIDSNFKGARDAFIIDIDRDGYNDVVASSDNNGVAWYQNLGTGTDFKKFQILSDSGFGGRGIWVDDIGNDGYYDVIVGSYGRSRVYWFEQPDDPQLGNPWETYYINNVNRAWEVFVAQVDTDKNTPDTQANHLDIVATSYSSNQVKFFTATMEYPENITLTVGRISDENQNDHDFKYSNEVTSLMTTQNLNDKFDNYLQAGTTVWDTDEYGNNITEVYLDLYSPGAGRVIVDNINVVYTYEARVEVNPHNDRLYNELNELIPDEGSGNYRVNVCLQSYTSAWIKLSGINIKYNSPPRLLDDIGSHYHVLEGSSNSHLIDLHDFYDDDFDLTEDLIYKIEYNSRPDKVWTLISNAKFVKVSATKDDDWFGTVTLQVSATDSLGLKTNSNKFNVSIRSSKVRKNFYLT
jgi:hypothetical protein